ncbi:MAG: type I restriction enzyme HsdR N-terminal domain-containing protein [Taibaiella sp.]|nr:type I restriction enzyme HsdR N-terminal domain-containing protein [Taibaiella sp.]
MRTKQEEGRAMVFDPIRRGWFVLTPEEHVRQYLVRYLLDVLQYPSALIAVEKLVKVGNLNRRYDVVVFGRDHKPWLLAECKSPDVPVSEATLHQLLAYHSAMPARYWLLTNGAQTFCADAGSVADIQWLSALPAYGG